MAEWWEYMNGGGTQQQDWLASLIQQQAAQPKPAPKNTMQQYRQGEQQSIDQYRHQFQPHYGQNEYDRLQRQAQYQAYWDPIRQGLSRAGVPQLPGENSWLPTAAYQSMHPFQSMGDSIMRMQAGGSPNNVYTRGWGGSAPRYSQGFSYQGGTPGGAFANMAYNLKYDTSNQQVGSYANPRYVGSGDAWKHTQGRNIYSLATGEWEKAAMNQGQRSDARVQMPSNVNTDMDYWRKHVQNYGFGLGPVGIGHFNNFYTGGEYIPGQSIGGYSPRLPNLPDFTPPDFTGSYGGGGGGGGYPPFPSYGGGGGGTYKKTANWVANLISWRV